MHEQDTPGLRFSSVRWVYPHWPQSGQVSWQKIAEALRAVPGAWALIRTYPADQRDRAYSTASYINHRRIAAFADGGFQAMSSTDPVKANVYARYVGGDAS